MKKILFFGILASLSIISCKDDDEPQTAYDLLYGTWKQSKFVIYSGNNGGVLDTENADECVKKSTYNFKEDYYVDISYYENFAGNCEHFGNNSTIYAYDENSQILTYNGHQYPVYTLSSNVLEFEDDTYFTDFDGDGLQDRKVITFIK